MYHIISDKKHLITVFNKYSPLQALQVQENINHVLSLLNIPSEALLTKMKQEGLLVDHQDLPQSLPKYQKVSSGVLQKHLFDLFLDVKKLQAATIDLSLPQAVLLRATWHDLFSFLKLPSQQLLAEMAEEGVSYARLGVSDKAPETPRQHDKISQVKTKIAMATNVQKDDVDELEKFKISLAKAKLAASLANEQTADKVTKAKLTLASHNGLAKNHSDESQEDNKVTSLSANWNVQALRG